MGATHSAGVLAKRQDPLPPAVVIDQDVARISFNNKDLGQGLTAVARRAIEQGIR